MTISSVYEAHVPVGAIPKEPYSVKEIDEHPNADRIWATVKAVRDYAEAIGYEDGHHTGWIDAEDALS